MMYTSGILHSVGVSLHYGWRFKSKRKVTFFLKHPLDVSKIEDYHSRLSRARLAVTLLSPTAGWLAGHPLEIQRHGTRILFVKY